MGADSCRSLAPSPSPVLLPLTPQSPTTDANSEAGMQTTKSNSFCCLIYPSVHQGDSHQILFLFCDILMLSSTIYRNHFISAVRAVVLGHLSKHNHDYHCCPNNDQDDLV
jgi:hypothetical protein